MNSSTNDNTTIHGPQPLATPIALWDVSRETPAENLALDEAMLEARARGEIADTLRLWESPVLFVVLGAGCRVNDDVRLKACRSDGVPVLRRCSGGGTVLQGPGCLNFALSLGMDSHPALAGIETTNAWVLGRLAQALTKLLPEAPTMMGTSDLVFDGRKVGGNAQKRKKHAVLFHGTLLYDMDLTLVARYLAEPPRQPEYRQQRAHDGFIAKLPLTQPQLRRALTTAFSSVIAEFEMAIPEAVLREAESLSRGRYADRDWHFSL